jgi:tetratricopeptide (TPR) repeat protein
MRSIEEVLRRLEEAKGDTQSQAAVAAEFVVMARPESKRRPLRAALDAAAVLRWFDVSLLGKLLGVPDEEARTRFEALTSLPFIERYRMRDTDLRNIHEATRLGWRKKLAAEAPDRFRGLSLRAAEAFADERTPAGRIEWIYHLLCGDPDRGATELEKLNRDWSSRAHPEEHYALAAALRELEETRLVAGRARAWTLLVTAWVRAERGETAQLEDTAAAVLRLAGVAGDRPAVADAQCLLGDVRQARGDLYVAQAAFGECLSISRRLAEQDPSNAGWQRGLALACLRLGRLEANAGRHHAALPYYEEASRLFGALLERAPGFVQWEKDRAIVEAELALCRSRLSTRKGSVAKSWIERLRHWFAG